MNYSANVLWEKQNNEEFLSGKYSRVHQWSFDGGAVFNASSSPSIVPVPMSDAALVDPEEAFLASVASCHMLFFLAIASGKKYSVLSYSDRVEGIMGEDEKNGIMFQQITLNPKVLFSEENIPDVKEIKHMHKIAHKRCFIANSIRAKINIKL